MRWLIGLLVVNVVIYKLDVHVVQGGSLVCRCGGSVDEDVMAHWMEMRLIGLDMWSHCFGDLVAHWMGIWWLIGW